MSHGIQIQDLEIYEEPILDELLQIVEQVKSYILHLNGSLGEGDTLLHQVQSKLDSVVKVIRTRVWAESSDNT